jgi:hypothetical protein
MFSKISKSHSSIQLDEQNNIKHYFITFLLRIRPLRRTAVSAMTDVLGVVTEMATTLELERTVKQKM